jgi:hypothetical protein
MRRICFLSLLLATAALSGVGPASAQPGPPAPAAAPPPRDVIGDILDRRVPLPRDEDEPDTAGQPRTAPEAEPEPSALPSGVQARAYTPAPRSVRDAPVRVDEAGKTPDGPPGVRDLAYDSRIRSSFASAESFQGPLEGGWTLSAGGQDLYALQLVDRRDRLEGVWRDVRRKGSLNASGVVDDLRRQGAELTLRFTPSPGAAATVATLHDGGAGLWSGEIAEGGARRAVTLRRTGP